MKFSKAQLAAFGADDGAWSIVTEDERENSQITISDSDGEAEVAIQALTKANIPRRPKGQKWDTKVKIFKRNGDLIEDDLAICFPKPVGYELRIYRRATNGFDYETGDVWFIFRKQTELTVGSMPKVRWEALARSDFEDSTFQSLIEDAALGDSEDSYFQTAGGKRIKRCPKTALKALKKAGFKCEYDPRTRLFISRATKKPYVEAHHFIPLSASEIVSSKLDITDNIVALSPHWHRAIHYGEDDTVRKILSKLAKNPSRKALLTKKGLTFPDLCEIYSV